MFTKNTRGAIVVSIGPLMGLKGEKKSEKYFYRY